MNAPDSLSERKQTKFIIVTGGVVSGLGKGIAAASIGRLLVSAGLKVIPIKMDGYLNVDPGTMNPMEHGEVFVLDDGGEVDMDFGHYERFLNVVPKSHWNLTMGKIFDYVRQKERKGDYLGKTVQYIPHVTSAIKEKIMHVVSEERPDVVLIEVGGTIGDLENELYVEAVRQLKKDVGVNNIAYVHLTYVPIFAGTKEQKSKPTQQSVNILRQRGLQPDIIIGRCARKLDDSIKEKIALFADIEKESVITGLDVDNVYEIPLVFQEEGILKQLNEKLQLNAIPKMDEWKKLVSNMSRAPKTINIALCGKYTKLEDSYASVIEALHHAGAHVNVIPKIHWIETTRIEEGTLNVEDALRGMDGIIVPGGFGSRGAEGKISVIQHARTHHMPYLGLCYGMQLAVIEYARNRCGLSLANSTEINPRTTFPVIDLLPEQTTITQKGATMRLGGQDVEIKPQTNAEKLFGPVARLRFRHRYEVNPAFIEKLENMGLIFSGKAPQREIMQIMELPDHPFFMATQAHPELTSRLDKPCPFFHAFVRSCVK
ncbi:MAG: CTP synthase (glutamine hydrolyzing) [Candidatus Diapherotrites archaeon]|uniref:CTP synthase n=1 Tax=Candidatus Iainarchaeum sp. TaxID=3101447 RepID=A0A8T4C9V5_9ARCH|nr:CTP synthase (glutamine hydrolyzing) [Candidatus Diapherotrites archaeon]